MSTALWTALAVAAMVGIFVACTAVVTIGVRFVEDRLAARRQRRSA